MKKCLLFLIMLCFMAIGVTGCGSKEAGLYNTDGELITDWETLMAENLWKVEDGVLLSIGDSDREMGVGKLVIPNNVTSIGEKVFKEWDGLMGVEIPDSVTSIGLGAFRECLSLSSVEIPDSVTIIEEDAFKECGSLTNLEIPDSVTRIGKSAFKKVPLVIYNGSAEGSPWGAEEIRQE